MARTQRIRRKDLRQPDEFLTFSRRALAWSEENRTTVWIATGAVVVVLLAVLAYRAITASQEASAAKAYGQAHALLEDRKYPEAAAAFQEVANAYSSSGVGVIAQFQAANALLVADRASEAALAYQRFLDAGPPTDYLRQRALVGLGAAHEKRGAPADAQAAYASAAAIDGPLNEEALLGEARAADEAGDTAKAKELYQRVIEKYPTSERRMIVRARLSALGWTPPPAGETANAGAGSADEVE